MKVTCHYRNDPERGLTDPVLEKDGRRFVFRLYSGDICDPILGTLFGYHWFNPPYPKYVWRTFCTLPILPFIAWRWPFINRAGYLGFKVYGVDSDEYKNWMPEEDIYEGSQALCTTIRPFATMG